MPGRTASCQARRVFVPPILRPGRSPILGAVTSRYGGADGPHDSPSTAAADGPGAHPAVASIAPARAGLVLAALILVSGVANINLL